MGIRFYLLRRFQMTFFTYWSTKASHLKTWSHNSAYSLLPELARRRSQQEQYLRLSANVRYSRNLKTSLVLQSLPRSFWKNQIEDSSNQEKNAKKSDRELIKPEFPVRSFRLHVLWNGFLLESKIRWSVLLWFLRFFSSILAISHCQRILLRVSTRSCYIYFSRL